ncbi:MAG: PepSY domain-containing protein [Nitrospirales bacterium]|nr:PepSY domain-containing protein [Nitrospira sp.]MDR4500635.1 PepSY domain-containing protein [Nitrospirales bacterium]
MNVVFQQSQQSTHQKWCTPQEVLKNLRMQRYRVFAITYQSEWYGVDAHDPLGSRVELKVNPKTGKIFTWVVRGKNMKNQNLNGQGFVRAGLSYCIDM